MITRDELQKIRDKAMQMAMVPNMAPLGVRAWSQLAGAADTLDAMMARAQTKKAAQAAPVVGPRPTSVQRGDIAEPLVLEEEEDEEGIDPAMLGIQL